MLTPDPLVRQALCLEALFALGPAGPVANTFMPVNGGVIGAKGGVRTARIVISYIWVSSSERGRGLGSRTLRHVLSIIDDFDLPAQVRPAAFDRTLVGKGLRTGLTTRQLKTWYASHGFAPSTLSSNRPYMFRDAFSTRAAA